MSWIYGATGEMHFWNEQIKAERRIKKQWEETYGADVVPAREREAAEKAAAEAKEAAHKEYIAKATARPKLGKVSSEWKTICGPTGSSSARSTRDSRARANETAIRGLLPSLSLPTHLFAAPDAPPAHPLAPELAGVTRRWVPTTSKKPPRSPSPRSAPRRVHPRIGRLRRLAALDFHPRSRPSIVRRHRRRARPSRHLPRVRFQRVRHRPFPADRRRRFVRLHTARLAAATPMATASSTARPADNAATHPATSASPAPIALRTFAGSAGRCVCVSRPTPSGFR